MIVHHEITGDGPPLVLVGSIGSTIAMWEPQLPALAERYRVIRVDHRGHGGSPVPPGPYTMADLGGDVLALLDHLGERQVSYAGLSLGGMVGMWLAVHAPERMSSLALLCTSAYMDPEMWTQRIQSIRADGMAAVAENAPARWFSAGYRERDPDTVERFKAMVSATSADGYMACAAAIRDMDQRADLEKVSTPTLVLAGSEDPATPPEHARDIAARIGGSRLVVVPGVAHMANVEQPDAVNQHLLEHFDG